MDDEHRDCYSSDYVSSLHDDMKMLRDALTDMFALIDEGQLVRNTERDHEPDYAIRSLMFVRRLAAAKQTLDSM